MNALFISDLHLETPESARFTRFSQLLEQASAITQDVFILGDLVEVWVGDDDDDPLPTAIRQTLRKLTEKTRVHVMPGNRDFLYGSDFVESTGVSLLPDPFVLETPMGSLLLAHGDAYCTQDTEYMAMRQLLRSEQGLAQLKAQSLEERRALARQLRERSMTANELKAENIMDVTIDELGNDARQHECKLVIHGHTHRPGISIHEWGTRYVLGDWNRCAWISTITDESIQLHCVSI